MIERNVLRSPRSTTSQSCCLFLSKLFLYCFLLSFCIIPSVARNHLKSSISSSILEIQAVLARSTRVVPTAIIDPLTWLACLKVEGDNAYQFFLQPPNAPAFIGNTAYISLVMLWPQPVLVSLELDHQIELDLLTSLEDDIELIQ
ncbi:hypothetical protein TSUD_237970 [Trifolium subterraneum]|uniref:Uncharacterized protein n=1 Tax=Trifolium subterraneum TaxID=3900 RepID=A0A2Z6P0P8_TRISU|nr:hypothetical protein TSUD_237970 [Trifolium subterraneum]